MSLRTMPLLFLNMGGEMVYILDQRLNAQSVADEKSVRVMVDIVGTMFTRRFVDEIFKPQPLYSRRGMRALFEKLAHASIMRLNATSMDKLYDLMTMAVKYQLSHVVSPKDTLLITLNHLDGMRKLVQGQNETQAQIDYAYDKLKATYFHMNNVQLHTVRMTMLQFYQDCRVKVSMLLREKKQKDDGRFLILTKGMKCAYGGGIPGTIKYYNAKGEEASTEVFNSGGSYTETIVEGVLDKTAKKGDRGIEYGCNMYKNVKATEVQGGLGSSALGATDGESKDGASSSGSRATHKELDLLAKLLRPRSKSKSKTDNFSLSLFNSESDERSFNRLNVDAAKEQTADNVVKIDATKRERREISKIVGEVEGKPRGRKKKGDELLELMDNMDV